MTVWNNRIVGTGEEDPATLVANPLNFRTHPQPQAKALAGVLREVGVVQNIIVNKRTGRMVDGHLRVAIALQEKQPSIPVVYVDLDEAEEAKVLATLDPIAAMAGADADVLAQLLEMVSTEDEAVQALLSQIAEDAGIIPPDFEPVGIEEQGRLDQKKPVQCPECGHEFTT